MFLTKVFSQFKGDTTFPQINYDDFSITFESEILTCEKNGLKYQFIDLAKK